MKKVLSLVLALVMVLGLTTVALAKTDALANYTAEDVGKNSNKLLKIWFYDGAGWTDTLKLEQDVKVQDYDTTVFDLKAWTYASGTSVFGIVAVKLSGTDTAETGDIQDGTTYWRPLTKQQVSRWDVEVSLSSASSTWKKVSIDQPSAGLNSYASALAYLKFEYQPYLDSLSKKQSKDTINLKADGNAVRSGNAEITSNYKNSEYKTEDEDDDEVDLLDYQARIVNPKKSISKALINLEYDAILKTRFFEAKKIYAVVKEPVTDLTMALTDKYGFAFNRSLVQIGMNVDASKVNFGESGTWVYAIDNSKAYDPVADSVKLVYVGKGDQDLAIYQDYFFSLKELTLASAAPAEEPPIESSGSAPAPSNPTGGPSGSAPNANYNPGTGC